MLEMLTDFAPSIAHLSVVTLAGFSIGAGACLLYLLSRSNHYLVITAVTAIYASVPLIPPHLF
jgi:hypothetical protein